MRPALCVPLVACTLFVSRGSPAQDVAAAEELYRQGVMAFRAGNYDAACQEIGSSYRLDPHPGVLFTLATCEARLGRIASAAAHYEDFLQLVSTLPQDQQAIHEERRRAAAIERASLLADVPYLTVVLDGELPRHVVVRKDGATLEAAAIGRELPVDPGEHVVSLGYPSGTKQEQRVVVAKREHKTVVMHPVLIAAQEPGTSPSVLPNPLQPSGVKPAHSMGSWPYVAGVVGGIGLAVGVAGGLLAIGQYGITKEECDGPACTPRGKTAADTGKVEALASTVAFGVGVAGLTALALLYLVDYRAAPSAQVDPPGVQIHFSADGIRFSGLF